MQIQVNTDNHIQGSAKLSQHVESVIENSFDRFGDRITRVEVRFSDENSSRKGGGEDKCCVVEARLAGLQPINVSHNGATLEQALSGAVDKLLKTVDRTLARRDDPKGRTSFSGE